MDAPKVAPKVFVALPCYGDVPAFFARALTQFLQEADFDLVVKWQIGDSLVSRARNTLTADFLETDCTHLLFIDTDLVFSADQVSRMLGHGVPLVGGFYPKKQDGPLAWVCNALIPPAPADERGLQPLRYIGTGFMLISRGVIEQMLPAVQAYRADGTGRVEHDFWSVGVYWTGDHGRYLSEDWWFCQRCLDLGIPVYGDTAVVAKHMGFAIYPLSHQQPEFLKSP